MYRDTPGPGQESVWDYPRPPAVQRVARRVRVKFGDRVVASSEHPIKVMETSHPPVYYIPLEDVDASVLVDSPHETWCEYKGRARYFSVNIDGHVWHNAAWYYPDPSPGYEELRDAVAFYPQIADEILLDGVRVTPQPGHFYGGWVTPEVVGPFKGEPGTMGW